jgi:hypothetical protein
MIERHAVTLAALLRDRTIPPAALATDPGAFVAACREDDLTGLVYDVVASQPIASEWLRTVRSELEPEARSETVEELLRRRELVSVLDALAEEGVEPILIKGTALAYSHYAAPAARRCRDTDLLIRRDQESVVRRILATRGYSAPLWCDGELLFHQFPLRKIDAFGLVHTLDFHWKISTQSFFADLLTFDEVAEAATSLPGLGGGARAAGPLHALLVACIHPVMHHRNARSLVWIYDVHLLASRLSASEFDRFATLALAKQVAAICAHQLQLAAVSMGTRIPDAVMERLDAVASTEPSAAYLRPNRGWGSELVSNLQGLSSWRGRIRLLREVAFPHPAYVLRAYGFSSPSPGVLLLPVLYFHRLMAGGWKVILGRK